MKAIRKALMAAACAATIVAATSAAAETLREALERTYRSNPTLMAQRERLRVLDESVAIARAGLRPNVSANGGLNQDLFNSNSGEGRNFSLGVDVTYPLFNAGRVRNQIRAATRGSRPAARTCAGPKATSSPKRSAPTWT
jgi:outer membrane protein